MKSLILRCCLLLGAASLAFAGGCQLVGVMYASAWESGDHDVAAEYKGLEGKSFAVVVNVDRVIQADHPDLVEYLTAKVTERLSDRKIVPRAGGYVAPKDVVKYLYDHPGWNSRPMGELAKGLGGVQRIVLVEVFNYQLHEPGNQYEWSGEASGTVAVIETDAAQPDDFAFERQISVKFPDKSGLGPQDMSQSAMMTALALRFVDRAAWLMYDHKEANKITY